jgi:uncharacterized protein YkwD
MVRKSIVYYAEFVNLMGIIFCRLGIVWMLFADLWSPSPFAKADKMETDILQYVNEDRKDQGLPALNMNAMESSLAAKHSQDMASGKVKFGHEGFNSRAKAIQKALGSVEIGENVASGPMTAREVVDGWLHSPGHKKNIEGNFTLTGIGYAVDKKGEIYFTQIFSR